MGNFQFGISLIKKAYNCLAKTNTIKKTASTMNDYAKKHLTNIQNDTVKNNLLEAFDFYSINNIKNSKQRLVQIDDIAHKYESCSDDYLKKELENLIKSLSKKDASKKGEILDLIEGSLDSLNCSEGQYCPLFKINSSIGVKTEYKIYHIIAKALCFLLREDVNTKYLSFKDIGKSEVQKFLIQAKKLKKTIDTEDFEFKAFTKYSPLEDYINKYKDSNIKAVNYLYEKAYVSKQKMPELQDFCRRIDKKFNVKTLDYTFYDYNPLSAYKIEKELEMFQNAGLSPNLDLLKISNLDYQYIKNKKAGGFYHRSSKTISLPTWIKNRTFRHELIHSVDENPYKFSSSGKLANTVLEEDLRKAGATEGKIAYAKSKLSEKKAVLGEFYNDKYSQETKDFMIENGLPKETLNLKEIDFYDHIKNIKPRTADEMLVINDLRKKLGGIIPQELAKNYDYKLFKEVSDLIKNKASITTREFKDICDKIVSRIPE